MSEPLAVVTDVHANLPALSLCAKGEALSLDRPGSPSMTDVPATAAPRSSAPFLSATLTAHWSGAGNKRRRPHVTSQLARERDASLSGRFLSNVDVAVTRAIRA